MLEENKIFFNAGDTVMLNKEIMNSPVMMVTEKVSRRFTKNTENINEFLGIKCFWIDSVGAPHEWVFNTKDLMHVVPTK